jgi:tRNA pseudouridine55 synthase
LSSFDGLLVLDKPAGMTSHDVVAIVRRTTGEKSVGHLGTLDPMATGVLPLLLGRYTRLAQFFGLADKEYSGHMRFGFATDTFDADGTPQSENRLLDLNLEKLRILSGQFHGEMDQMPPIFSAKKLNGVPAHKLARAGLPVPVKAAHICIHNFELLTLEDSTASFTLTVSSGGFVRSVAHELGQLAGCGAHLASLRRARAGVFALKDAITVTELKESTREMLLGMLPHPRTLLPEMPSVTVDDSTAARLRNGMQVNLPEYSNAPLVKVFTGPAELFGICRRIAGTLMQPHVNLG